MLPVVGMFRGLFLGSVLVWYSSSVWKTLDNYYNQEFKKYLQKERQERRFPSEDEVCRSLPEASCTVANAVAHDAVSDAVGGGGQAGGEGGDGGAEDLGANAAPKCDESSGDEGGGVGGSIVSRDVTHMGARHLRAEDAANGAAREDTERDGDTCPALF